MKKHDILTLQATYQHDTAAAWLLLVEGTDEAVWLPKSIVEYDRDNEELQIPERFALEKGLI